MHEHDRVGVNIVVTGISAAGGFAVGGPVGAAIGAVLPEVVREITARRVRNVESVADDACELTGFAGPQLVEWVRASDNHAAFLVAALEAAWDALDLHKLRTLGYVLADGMRDEARLDINRLVIRALRELEAGHVRVLKTLADDSPSEHEGWTLLELVDMHGNLADGLEPIVATLEQVGCVERVVITYPGSSPTAYLASGFGHVCLERILMAGAGGWG